MKKLSAILLIFILSFNWYGYRIVMNILAKESDQQLELRLDNNDYHESQLIEVRVPLNMPYQNDQAEFERHYGEMEVDGKYYTYVKRKIENGWLVLMCIPNSSKEKIKAAGNDYFKTANGLDSKQQDNKQNNSNKFAKNFWTEYDGSEADFTIDIFTYLINKNFLDNTSSLKDICLSSPGQPPEHAAS
ncbi:MAG: hypothetical protein ACXWWC_12770 [Chitinophagaceae bacterium]